ncbi:cation:proton antiporter [Lyngbya confervoides]|uniref:Cation:proton antiporter n=1 Tax=Lyngbya confervoides BDU141951 TaxID=1574623 RepID=A0ABD4T5N2_9CYAN|nr:sodium:proton antiporter [Lyngbya confervoides]MCM1983839.1 cation:proton antiporter [Lyngbya confervoides BDU141951]
MEGNLEITLLIVITVVAGIGAQIVAALCKVPSIVFLLLFGITLGRSGLGIVQPALLGNGLEVIVSLSVALILFEGGLNLKWSEISEVSVSLRNLVTLGSLITLFGAGAAAHWLSEFPWQLAILYGSLVVVTGPTVVAPLLKQVQADRRVSTLLEGEGVLIDPIGAILAVVVLNIVLQEHPAPLTVATGLISRLGLGIVIGGSGGWLLSRFLRRATFLSDDLKNLSVLAGVWGLFGLSQYLISESGLMTAVAAGVVLRNAELPAERRLLRFKNQLSILAISVLFILLSADLSLPSLVALGWGGLLTVAALMLIVRPLNILLSTFRSDLNLRQKAFLSWVAPRGIVAASVASLFSISLTKQEITGGEAIKALVFLTIILTVCLQGLSARWVAGWLKIRSSEATGAIIIGCHPLGRLVAGLIQDRGESVVMIDSDPDRCREAEADHFQVYLSSALNTEVLNEAGVTSIGSVLAITSNAEVNAVLASSVIEEFSPPRVLAFCPDQVRDNASAPSLDKRMRPEVKRAFAPNFSVKRWNEYYVQGEIKLLHIPLQQEPEAFEQQRLHLQALINVGQIMPILVEQKDSLRICTAHQEWHPGDRVIAALYTPKGSPATRLHLEMNRPLAMPLIPD